MGNIVMGYCTIHTNKMFIWFWFYVAELLWIGEAVESNIARRQFRTALDGTYLPLHSYRTEMYELNALKWNF